MRGVRKSKHANIGVRGIHTRALLHEVHEAIANAVLDAKQREVKASQWRTASIDVHADRGVRPEPVFPLRAAGKVVDVFFVFVVGYAHAHQDAACGAAVEAGTLRVEHRALERHGALLHTYVTNADGSKFLRTKFF